MNQAPPDSISFGYPAPPLITTTMLDATGRVVRYDFDVLSRTSRYHLRIVSDPRDGETIEQWFAGLVDVGHLPATAIIRSFELGYPGHPSEVAYFEPDEASVSGSGDDRLEAIDAAAARARSAPR